ncbi:MAG: phosphoenolpyruvate--protein phosphotransferase [Candidatus Adiutrix sp.]|jgi:phosphotransferase system enzyme I (PtsI)|nr:phosphoenolpyruvate--protein phosphotransferase [Candidatus Adiutrix sp.]
MTASRGETVVNAAGVSAGIAIGEALVLSRPRMRLPNYRLPNPELVEAEIERLDQARDQVRARLSSARTGLPPELYSQAGIIDVHLLLLDDPLLSGEAGRLIREKRINAEQAVLRTIEKVNGLMAKVADEYIGARLSDVEMLAYALISALRGDKADRLPLIPAGSILVVRDISPAELMEVADSETEMAGLVIERGGRTSHTAIVAQALELPTVIGAKNIGSRITSGDTIIIDGRSGRIIIRPDQETLDNYRDRQAVEWSFTAEIVRSSHLPALTLDDRRINILGNMELEEELPAILNYGSEGVGLYRTEFMYLNRKILPTEEELFQTYSRVVGTVAPRQVVIRTLDLGNDKIVTGPAAAAPGSLNQALGLRGIRHCLSNRDLFQTQIRAILRASVLGDLKIMLPMVSNLDELRATRALIDEAEESLRRQGAPHKAGLPLGVMIEVPATLFIARELASEAAFFAVGTNDLIQYALAVDRANPEVSEIFQPLHPGILRMLKLILDIGRETGTPVSICGDMAAGGLTAGVLVGLGAETLSMPPAAIPKIKRLVRMSSLAEMSALTAEILAAGTAGEAAALAASRLSDRFPELLN